LYEDKFWVRLYCRVGTKQREFPGAVVVGQLQLLYKLTKLTFMQTVKATISYTSQENRRVSVRVGSSLVFLVVLIAYKFL